MRNAIVENFGALIRYHLATAVNVEDVKSTVDDLLVAILRRNEEGSKRIGTGSWPIQKAEFSMSGWVVSSLLRFAGIRRWCALPRSLERSRRSWDSFGKFGKAHPSVVWKNPSRTLRIPHLENGNHQMYAGNEPAPLWIRDILLMNLGT